MKIFSLNKKKQKPFYSLFHQLSPKDFIFIFRFEYTQTLAFILSYAPTFYLKRAIWQMKDKIVRKVLSDSIIEIRNRRKTCTSEFIKEMEKAALEYIN
jgi:hypothetical protein